MGRGSNQGSGLLSLRAATDTQPSIVTSVHENGTRVEEYRKDGRLHRDGEPARTEQYPDGSFLHEFYNHGVLHRDDGPARIKVRVDGSKVLDYYDRYRLTRTVITSPDPAALAAA